MILQILVQSQGLGIKTICFTNLAKFQTLKSADRDWEWICTAILITSYYLLQFTWCTLLLLAALIFYSQDDRPEATEEADTLQTSLSKVAARVDRHVWINGPDLQVHVQQILGELSANCSLLFISVMSHGRTGALCGPDGIIVPVNDLLERITKLIPTDLQLVSNHASVNFHPTKTQTLIV